MRWQDLLLIILLISYLPGSLLAAEADASEDTEKVQVEYLKLAPSLVTNVQGGAKYVRCDVQLMTRDPEALEKLKLHTPAIRHELLLLLSDQQGGELKQPKGKEKLRKQALASVQKVMKGLTKKPMTDDLFFTSFFVQ